MPRIEISAQPIDSHMPKGRSLGEASGAANFANLDKVRNELRTETATHRDRASISKQANVAHEKENTALRDINNKITVAQTAENALTGIASTLKGLFETASQASSDALKDTQRGELQAFVKERTSEINRIASETEFAGQKLLDGSFDQGLQIGGPSSPLFSIGDMSASGLRLDGIDLSTPESARASVTRIESALNVVHETSDGVARVESSVNRPLARVNPEARANPGTNTNHEAERPRIEDTKVAAETAELAKSEILRQAGVAMLAQANSNPQAVLSLLRG